MTRLVRFLFIILVAILSISASAETILVDCEGDGDYVSISDAVAAAASGDTVQVSPCFYEEQVHIPHKTLSLIGLDPTTTVITSSTDTATITKEGRSVLLLKGLTVRHSSPSVEAIRWDQSPVTIDNCIIPGTVRGRSEGIVVTITDSQIHELDLLAWYSFLTRSRFGIAHLPGRPLYNHHHTESSDCTYEAITFSPGFAGISSNRDSIGMITIWGGLDSQSSLSASHGVFGTIRALGSAELALSRCEVGSIDYSVSGFFPPNLSVSGCLVNDFVSIYPQTLPAPSSKPNDLEGYSIEHNTILGWFSFECEAGDASVERIRSNIVVGATTVVCGSDPMIWNNIFVSGADLDVPNGDIGGNAEVDPQFCGEGDYTLHETSPAVGMAHDSGDIGAFGVGCGTVSVRYTSWGRLKTLFRQ